MSADLSGKTALVTGASSGIGLATARAMLEITTITTITITTIHNNS